MVGETTRRALWMRKIASEVSRGVIERIRSGELAAGSLVPARDALAAENVTTVGVIDRAFELLTEEGWLAQDAQGHYRIASGPTPDEGFSVPHSFGATVEDIVAVLELRMGVETIAAALAAERRSDAAMAAIRSAAAAYERTQQEGIGSAPADFEFHRAIAGASQNQYILELLEYLGPLLIPRMRIKLPMDEDQGDQNLNSSIAEHARLVAAIEARDADSARDVMREHLSRTITLVRELS